MKPESRWRQGLLTPELEAAIQRRRRLRSLSAWLACAAGLLFAATSVDAYRARVEESLDGRAADLQAQVESSLELQARWEELRQQLVAVSEVESRKPSALATLVQLSQLLPENAWIRTMRAEDGEWQIEGYARDAAALVPLFENHPYFRDVRSRAPTSRTQLGGDTYENFSLALRTIRAP